MDGWGEDFGDFLKPCLHMMLGIEQVGLFLLEKLEVSRIPDFVNDECHV